MTRRVLIVGVGGVGCPAAMALARASDAVLRLADDDRVDLSNLHRQVLFEDEDAGTAKVSAAARRIAQRWPGTAVEPRRTRFDDVTADDLLDGVDVVIDGSDNFATRFAVNDACVEAGVPLVHAAVLGWSGQVLTALPDGPCYRCLFEAPPPPDAVPTCARAGVLGPVAGVIGALAAAEALRLLDGRPAEHAGSLLTYDCRNDPPMRGISFNRRTECAAHPLPPPQRNPAPCP